MARSCSVCARADLGTVNEQLRSARSVRSVALKMGISEDALGRHAKRHAQFAAPEPIRAAESPANDAPVRLDPLDELTAALRTRALAGNPADTREYRLALQAQSAAKRAAAPMQDLAAEPEWVALRSRLLDVLEPFPEARAAVADALEAI